MTTGPLSQSSIRGPRPLALPSKANQKWPARPAPHLALAITSSPKR